MRARSGGPRTSREALVVAALVGVLGFGAMSTFARLTDTPVGLRDFWSYRSATVGDALLLPLLCFALLRLAPLQTKFSARRSIAVVASGTAAVCAGAWLNLDALVRPDSDVNWTQPIPHHFNTPGWYHSTYLIITSGFLATLLVAAVFTVRVANSGALNPPATSQPAADRAAYIRLNLDRVTFAGVGFTSLLARDNFPAGAPVALSHLLAPCAAIALMLGIRVFLAPRGEALRSLVAATPAILAGLSLTAIFWNGFPPMNWETGLPVLIACTTATTYVMAVRYSHGRSAVLREVVPRALFDWLLTALSVAGPLLMVLDSGSRDMATWILAVIGAIVFSRVVLEIAIRRESHTDTWPSNWIGNVSALATLASWASLWWRVTSVPDDGLVPEVTLLLTSGASTFLVWKIVHTLISMVEELERKRTSRAALNVMKARAYLTLGSLFLLSLAMVWQLVLAGGDHTVKAPAESAQVETWTCIAIVLGGSGATWLLRNWRHSELAATVILGIDVLALLSLVAALREDLWSLATLYAMAPGLLVALFIASSIHSQSNRLTRHPRARSVRWGTVLGAVVTFIGISAFSAVTTLPTSWDGWRVTQGLVLWFASIVAAPLAAIVAYASAHRRRTLVDEGVTSYAGPLQDVFVAALMAVLAIALPFLAKPTLAWTTAAAVATVVFTWGAVGGWVPLTFNKRYVDGCTEQYMATGSTYPPDLIALETHIRRQNLLAGLLLSPFFIPILAKSAASATRLDYRRSIRAKLDEVTPSIPQQLRATLAMGAPATAANP